MAFDDPRTQDFYNQVRAGRGLPAVQDTGSGLRALPPDKQQAELQAASWPSLKEDRCHRAGPSRSWKRKRKKYSTSCTKLGSNTPSDLKGNAAGQKQAERLAQIVQEAELAPQKSRL